MNFFNNYELNSKNSFNALLPILKIKNDVLPQEDVFENYLHLRQSSFINFFVHNMIDIPICFKKSKSLRFKSFEFFFIKFINLLMKKGQYEKTVRIFLNSFFIFFDDMFEESIKNNITRFS
jgi:hypothetical protein